MIHCQASWSFILLLYYFFLLLLLKQSIHEEHEMGRCYWMEVFVIIDVTMMRKRWWRIMIYCFLYRLQWMIIWMKITSFDEKCRHVAMTSSLWYNTMNDVEWCSFKCMHCVVSNTWTVKQRMNESEIHDSQMLISLSSKQNYIEFKYFSIIWFITFQCVSWLSTLPCLINAHVY